MVACFDTMCKPTESFITKIVNENLFMNVISPFNQNFRAQKVQYFKRNISCNARFVLLQNGVRSSVLHLHFVAEIASHKLNLHATNLSCVLYRVLQLIIYLRIKQYRIRNFLYKQTIWVSVFVVVS